MKRREPTNMQMVRDQRGRGWHCARVNCYRIAKVHRVLTRPHQGPPMKVWVCEIHDLELQDRALAS